MTANGDGAPNQTRLRYAGSCSSCSNKLAAGTMASYDRESKKVTCSSCSNSQSHIHESFAQAIERQEDQELEVFAGVAGASARREGERRSAKREARIRKAHPKLGGVILALTEDPQSTKAWEVGARGEEKLGRRLDRLKSDTVHLLHDRRIPRSKANIDHIAVGRSGVFVIDAKKYKGRPNLRVEGGLFRERTETLFVGSRNCTTLITGAQNQVSLVVAALTNVGLSDVSVTGMLCFVDADWPLLGGEFTMSGVRVLWPGKAAELVSKLGPLDAPATQEVFHALARAFPPA